MSNLKIGGQNVGKIYFGDKLIMGGVNNQFINTYGNPVVIINKSNAVKRIMFDGNIINGTSSNVTITLNPTETALIYSPGNDDYFFAVDAMQVDISTAIHNDDPDDPYQRVEFKNEVNVTAGEHFYSMQSSVTGMFVIIMINN